MDARQLEPEQAEGHTDLQQPVNGNSKPPRWWRIAKGVNHALDNHLVFLAAFAGAVALLWRKDQRIERECGTVFLADLAADWRGEGRRSGLSGRTQRTRKSRTRDARGLDPFQVRELERLQRLRELRRAADPTWDAPTTDTEVELLLDNPNEYLKQYVHHGQFVEKPDVWYNVNYSGDTRIPDYASPVVFVPHTGEDGGDAKRQKKRRQRRRR